MKKYILVISLLSILPGYSQVKKGAVLFGPTISYGQNKSTNTAASSPGVSSTNKSLNFNGTLRLGYFITDKIAVGIIGGYSDERMKITNKNPNTLLNTSETKINLVSAGVFARTYKLFKESKFGVFGELQASYLAGSSNTGSKSQSVGGSLITRTTKANVTGFSANLSPGFVYFMSEKIGLEVSFGSLYFNSRSNQYYDSGEKTTKVTNSNLNFSFNTFTLGMIFYLSK